MRLCELICKVLKDINSAVGWQRDVQIGLLQTIVRDNNTIFTQFSVSVVASKNDAIFFTISDSCKLYTGIYSPILNDATLDTDDENLTEIVQNVVTLMNKEV